MEKYRTAGQVADNNMAHVHCMQAVNANTQYVTLTAFALQRWFHEHLSVLNYIYFSCLVNLRFSPGFIESSS